MSTTLTVSLFKTDESVRLGMSFAPDRSADSRGGCVITAVKEGSKSAAAGLEVGDHVLSINGHDLVSSLEAAMVLRELEGEICLCVERSLLPRVSSPSRRSGGRG